MKGVVASACGKINVGLRVSGKRADGFHELRTVFQSITLRDTLTCIARPGPFALQCRWPGVPLDASNLVWRAAEILWQALGRDGQLRDVLVTIDKRIPPQSGLGGGSADAAATLLALAHLWNSRVPWSVMVETAARVGADVPFFLSGGTACGTGRGDNISAAVDLPRFWVVLVLPSFGVSTAEAYAWHDELTSLGSPARWPGPVAPRQGETFLPADVLRAGLVNDLENAVVRHHPEIGLMKEAVLSAGAVAASMSGSGSAVFGLFRNRQAAVAAASALRRLGWRTVVTRTLDRKHYMWKTRPMWTRLARTTA